MRSFVSVFAALFLFAAAAEAAVFVVDDPGEQPDATPGDGLCMTAGGKCTLVAAMGEANAAAGADTIQMPLGTYTVSATLPVVTTPITIQPTTGSDPAMLVIQASNTGHPRLFDVAAPGALTLQALTLTNAQTGTGSAVRVTTAAATLTNCVVTANGGSALYVTTDGSLTITDSTVSNNVTASGPGALYVYFSNVAVTNTIFSGNSGNLGGAAYLYTASMNTYTLSITGSTFSGNSSTNSGGALYASSDTLTIDSSTFTENTTSYALYGGGAIFTTGLTPGTIITDSTFTGNQATAVSGGNGGALFVLNLASCRGCTFSGNSATGNGGAVFAGANDGAEFDAVDSTFSGNTAFGGGGLSGFLKLASVTVTDNTATGAHGATGPGSSPGGGGGTQGLSVQARNAIVAGNHATGSPDCDGQITSLGYDLVGDGTNCTVTASAGNQVGTGGSPIDPGLATLSVNGGPTLTHALLATSPAGDAGDPAGCTDTGGATLLTDQRGQPRSVDGNSDGFARCDIGAYEAPVGTFPAATTTTTSTTATTTSAPVATTSSSTTTTVLAPTTTTSTTSTHATTSVVTTSTTLAAGCAVVPDGATFASIICRFESLLGLVNETPGLGSIGAQLTAKLQTGHDRAASARDMCAASDAKHAKQQLKKVGTALHQYAHRLTAVGTRRKVDQATRTELLAPVKNLQKDNQTLRRSMTCPGDGAT